jgi:hypothetical protein
MERRLARPSLSYSRSRVLPHAWERNNLSFGRSDMIGVLLVPERQHPLSGAALNSNLAIVEFVGLLACCWAVHRETDGQHPWFVRLCGYECIRDSRAGDNLVCAVGAQVVGVGAKLLDEPVPFRLVDRQREGGYIV